MENVRFHHEEEQKTTPPQPPRLAYFQNNAPALGDVFVCDDCGSAGNALIASVVGITR